MEYIDLSYNGVTMPISYNITDVNIGLYSDPNSKNITFTLTDTNYFKPGNTIPKGIVKIA